MESVSHVPDVEAGMATPPSVGSRPTNRAVPPHTLTSLGVPWGQGFLFGGPEVLDRPLVQERTP